MPNGYIIADGRSKFFVGSVDACSILNIDLVPHLDKVYISSDDCVEPKAALVSTAYVTNNCRVLCDETIFTKLRGKPSDCFY